VISRYFVIFLATVAAILRARDHAWVETIGLGGLAVGLTILRLADTRQQPGLKRIAWFCFALTLIAMGVVFQRDYLR
jgi:hypothetical protein